MLFRLFIFIPLLTQFAAFAFGHGDGRCNKLADGTLLKISHISPDIVGFIGGHGHLNEYPSGLFGKSFWTPGGYEDVQARIAGGYWDEDEMFTDCVAQTPRNIGGGGSSKTTPTDVIPPVVVDPEPIVLPEPVVEMVSYLMTFREGVGAYHLPIKPAVFYLTDLFAQLGHATQVSALRPTVQVWSRVYSEGSLHDEWISRYRGFVIEMEQEVMLTLTGIAKGYGYDFIYLKDGLNLIGVPRKAQALETVADFFSLFSSVVSVKGIAIGETGEVFTELDGTTLIDGETGYLIESDGDAQRAIWGTQWTMTASAAPGAAHWRYYQKMATTWGALKGGTR